MPATGETLSVETQVLRMSVTDASLSFRVEGTTPAPEPHPSRAASALELSIIVPVYNEGDTIAELLRSLLALPYPRLDIVVVDDGSTDDTASTVEAARRADRRIRLLRHESNRGKGAAIRTALPRVHGDVIVIQDGDLENDPRDLMRMVRLFADSDVSVVYGSRWLTRSSWRRKISSYCAAAFLSALTNGLYGSRITDEPTCYKMFRAEVRKRMRLEADGFDFCPEVTAKALLAGHSIREVPVSYYPRSRRDGKKISVKDGWAAVRKLVSIRLKESLRWP